MDGNIVGFAAVVMIFGIPMAALYTYYRVRKLRTEERLAAIARGVTVPMEPGRHPADQRFDWIQHRIRADGTGRARCPGCSGVRSHTIRRRTWILPGFELDSPRPARIRTNQRAA